MVEQWYTFKNKVGSSDTLVHLQTQHLYQRAFVHWKHDFPALLQVIRFVLLIPVDTAECERGFSLMNRLKTDVRNRMGMAQLNDIMFICLHGPKSVTDFNPDRAIKLWLARGGERGRRV